MTDKEVEAFAGLVKAVGDLQARSFVQHYILQDLWWTIAPTLKDPERFAARLFERIANRMEQGGLPDNGAAEHPVDAEMRDYLERFCTLLGNSYGKPGS